MNTRKRTGHAKRTLFKVVGGLLAVSLAFPAFGPIETVRAQTDAIYVPPSSDWNKLRDIQLENYAWGYGSSVTQEVYRDKSSQKIVANDYWAQQYTTNGWQTFDFSAYAENGTLEFDAIGEQGGESFRIGFRDGVHERRVNGEFYKDQDSNPEETNEDALSKDVNEYMPLTTEWQHYSIPLKDLFGANPVFDPSKVQLLKLAGVSNAAQTFHIANMRVTSPDTEISAAPIKVNQIGYLQAGEKYALISGYYNELNAQEGTPFEVKRTSDNATVYSGALTLVKAYDPLSGEKVLKADFTALREAGDYYVSVEGVPQPSVSFEIGNGIYGGLLKDVQKFFYYQRANVDLDSQHAGDYAREGKYKQEDQALPLESNPSVTKDVSGGWWDAGDMGKYVTAGATAVSDLLWAYETYPNVFEDSQLNIPESGNGIPDLLDEIKVETDFFLKMQDTATGGFYAYVNREPAPKRFIMDGTGANSLIPTVQTANTVGALAHASIVFRSQPSLESYGDQLLTAAEKGWAYLEQHPEYIPQPDGPYNDEKDQNDRFYAAAALYRATGDSKYDDYVKAHYTEFETVFETKDFSHGINGMEMIGYYQYLSAPQADAQIREWFAARYAVWREKALDIALNQAVWRNSTKDGFYWGANSNVASMPMSLAIGSRILGTFDEANLQAAAGNLNYLLGINPLQLSYITGYGENRIRITHHEIFMRDFIVEMPNGYMVGGPNNGKAKFPAKAYNASTIDWETNEQALNYNSPLIFLTAMLQDAKLSESINLDRTSGTLNPGQETVIEATVAPNDATVKSVSAVSADPSIATVKNVAFDEVSGKTKITVEAKAAGVAQIVVSSKDGRVTATYEATVQPASAPPSNPMPSNPSTPSVPATPSNPAPTNPTPAAPGNATPGTVTPTPSTPAPGSEPASVFAAGLVDRSKLLQRFEQGQQAAAAQTPAAFSDVKGHWAEKALNGLAKLGVFEGYSDGTAKPNGAITRAEFAVLLDRLFDLQANPAKSAAFKDVNGHWGEDSIRTLASLGILNGYNDGSFKPGKSLTRQEAAVILTRVLDLRNAAPTSASAELDDLDRAGSFAADALKQAAKHGVIRGGTFRPTADATRAETLQMLWNALELDPDVKQVLDSL
ncbi:glycoside hydrolase family 9 protein [Saccharibacillus sacchari]|uniref:Glycoside hydrolase family 9 protein n=1 Tax=Saccharibacillus sacchari TaxID=456493 RepID=A0ACC6P7G3_9BACL